MTVAKQKPLLLSQNAKRASTHTVPTESKEQMQTFRYIIMHKKTLALPYVTRNEIIKTRSLNSEFFISYIDIPPEKIKPLQDYLPTVGGLLTPNEVQTLSDPEVDDVKDEEVILGPTTTALMNFQREEIYLNSPPACSKTKIGDDFVMFFLDTMIRTAKFAKVNVQVGNNYSGSSKPCNPHADYTFSVFQLVLGDPSLKCINIPIFNCGGHGGNQMIMDGLLDILDFAKKNPTKKIGVYFAVNGGQKNPVYTALMNEIVASGVLVCVSAGNYGINVSKLNVPPWNVNGILQVGATMPPGDRCPTFSNWSPLTQKPGVAAYLPGKFRIKQFNVDEQGTSFAVPQALAWLFRWWSNHPDANAQDAISAFTQSMSIIKAQGPDIYPPFTKDRLMRVARKDTFCASSKGRSIPEITQATKKSRFSFI